ncbi:hypothetical protein MMC25_000382 [Agyrium rufum]|nr:hypothetical protein [Agyrium rufum]
MARRWLSWLALFLVYAHAQTCSDAINTINTPDDALSLGSCSTLDGDVVVGSGFSGVLSLIGVKEIKGSLRCTGVPNLQSIAAADLKAIGESLEIHDLPLATSLTFAALSSVNNISAVNLPSLKGFQFPFNISVSNILADNAGIETVPVFGLPGGPALTLTVINNAHIQSLSLFNVTQLQSLTVAGNNNKMQLAMDSLQTINNINIWNVSKISLANLQSVNGSLQMSSNSFTNLTLPSLQTVEDSLTIDDHPNLSTLSFPSLVSVSGSFQIAGNPQVSSFALPNATSIEAIDFTGSFDIISLPHLKSVTNYLNIQSSSANLDCSQISSLAAGGSKTCETTPNPEPFISVNATVVYPVQDPESAADPAAPSSPTGSAAPIIQTTSKPSGLGTGAKIGVAIGCIILFGLILVALVFLHIRARRRRRATAGTNGVRAAEIGGRGGVGVGGGEGGFGKRISGMFGGYGNDMQGDGNKPRGFVYPAEELPELPGKTYAHAPPAEIKDPVAIYERKRSVWKPPPYDSDTNLTEPVELDAAAAPPRPTRWGTRRDYRLSASGR